MAQTKPFSSDQAIFLQEITDFLEAADKKEARPFIEQTFAPAWNGTFLTGAMRIKVVEVANYMQKKRFEAFPSFRDYLGAVAAFASSGKSAAEFDAWMASNQKIIDGGRKKQFSDFIAVCAGLFKENVLYASASTVWKSSNNKFTFAYDTVPKILFERMDLKCYAKRDSAVILGTTGTYLPTLAMWYGRGGKVTWERAGLKPGSTFAEWGGAYQVPLKSATFEVDSVQFNDPYFDRTLRGRVVDKVLAGADEDNASYPRFESYDRRQRVKDIVEGIDFEGGFTMKGAKLQGYGTRDEPAYLTFYRDKRPFIVTSGLIYTIEQEKISSDDVGVKITLDKDSIFHPSVSLKFIKDKKQLTLIKKDEGLSKGPYYDTYHELDMYFETLDWKQGDPVIHFGNLQGSSQTKASFESFDYFKEKRYMGMLGIDAVHPLVRLNDYTKQAGEVFTAQDFAVFTKLQKTTVVPMLIDMANKGYLLYDPENELVTVKPRLREHILASAKRRDYDVLQINSNIDDGKNALLNLLNWDLTVRGVSRIIVSDSQDVKIYPANKEVVVKKDRDFSFGGVVQAGKLTYHGKEYYFHYDPFVVDLLNVDSVSFMADSFEPDDNGYHYQVKVRNVLEQVSGTLEIDEPSNKSGIQQVKGEDGKMKAKYPEFPKFNSAKESYVFYDKKDIQKGVYDRDKFYYKSDPFQIDSLDDFTNKGLNFPGTLVSAGIFPDIREPLGLQPDYALGFVKPTGDAGLPLYGKKATFTSTISLNHGGLQGEGTLEYLTTTYQSKALAFCPDSTYGMADTLWNQKSAAAMKVPEVQAANVFTRLEPKNDKLLADRRAKPMTMYGGQGFLYGLTELTPKGMTGAGLVDFTNATLASDLFDFTTMQIHADTSDFRLTEGDTASIAFRTDNVNATVKLDERIGEFVSNGKNTKVEFPVNQYMCFMDRFKWFMDQGDIELEADQTAAAGSEDLQLSGSNFISTRPDQDSLSFMAPKARYDLKNHLITANDVPYIQVADAQITPDSNRVRIRRNAQMDPITNAVIVANFVNKYHTIYNATANIKAKRDYNAVGDIDYVDENQKKWPIHLDKVAVDTAYATYAEGKLGEKDNFQLSPHFDYFGDVRLRASEKPLTFDGSTRIIHVCEGLEKNWMRFRGPIDPMEVFIPVGDSLKDDIGADIGAGVFVSNDDPFSLYGTFLSRKKDGKDRPAIASKGLLFFDKAKQEYVIGPKDKIRQRNLPGDLVALNTTSCEITADGRIGAGLDLGRVQLIDVGTLKHVPGTKETTAQVTLTANFHFHDNALERMVEEIMAYPDQKQLDLQKTNFEKMMRELLGLEKSDKLISELSLKGELKKLPDELIRSLILSDVQLKWNQNEEAWVSDGPIGVASVLKKTVFRTLKGKVELARKRSGDSMTILLMLDDQTYYFFQYSRNYLYAYSSDQQFNTMLGELKDDKRVLEAKKDEAAYQFILTNKKKVDDFKNRYGL
ncbi:MAG: hypothetical protein IPJ76_02315 [Flavobacteriales bacterium]|nr:MAG: hypothetical protein IPJ76_02315 [Flavobacteriales bacterium]